MKALNLCCLLVAVSAACPLAAETLSIERNDPRPFRIHASRDETKATYALMRTLGAEAGGVKGLSPSIPINTMLPSMPIRLGGTRRFTDFSAHAAKMAAPHVAPPGLAAGEIMVRNA